MNNLDNKLKLNKITNLNFFENETGNKFPINIKISHDKVTEDLEATAKALAEESFVNPFLEGITNLSNTEKANHQGRFVQNASLGIYLEYLVTLIEENLPKLGVKSENKEFNEFLDLFRRVIITSLIKHDPILLKHIVIERTTAEKVEVTNYDTLIKEISLLTLSSDVIIKILKPMLHHVQSILANGEFKSLDIDPELAKELAKISLRDTLSKVSVKLSSSDKEPYIATIFERITLLYVHFNLCLQFILNLKDKECLLAVKWLISLLYSIRGIRTSSKVTIDVFDSVTRSIKGGDRVGLPSSKVKSVLPDLKLIVTNMLKGIEKPSLKECNIFESEYLHLSSASGPNGGPAMLTMPLDAKALIKEPSLYNSIINLGVMFGITGIAEAVSNMASAEYPNFGEDINTDQINIEKPITSSLLIFNELGDKWRIVAQVDSFSQTVLNPVHQLLTIISRSLTKTSAHFDQDTAFQRMYDLSQKTGFLGTFDLEAATDYLYLSLLSEVVEEIFLQAYGLKGVGALWSKVIATDRNFVVKGFEDKGSVKYKYGQPMGAKSSWVIMHIALIVLAKQAELNLASKSINHAIDAFSICGDDSEFADYAVYCEYLNICKSLNLAINDNKSFKCDSKDNKINVFGEYLKRFVYKGEVFRPLSPRLGSRFINNPQQQIFGFIKALLVLELDFSGEDLTRFVCFRNTYDRSGKVISNENTVIDSFITVTEQLYFWLLVKPELGGLHLPIPIFTHLFGLDGIYSHLVKLFPNLEPGLDAECSLLLRQITDFHYRARRRSDSAIASIFTKDGLVFLNKVVTKDTSKKVPVSVDWNTLTKNLTGSAADELFKAYPIYQIILKVIITQKANLLAFIQAQQEQIESLEKTPGRSSYTRKDYDVIKQAHKLAKKNQQMVDMFSVSVPELSEDGVEVVALSKRTILSIKSIGKTELTKATVKNSKSIAIKMF